MPLLDIRVKLIKTLGDIIGVSLCELRSSNGFLDLTQKAQTTKEKIVGLHQNSKFLS